MGNTTKKELSKKKLALVIVLAVVAVLLAVFAVLYFKKAGYYREHFYMGSTINGVDCSDLTVDEAEMLLQESIDKYSLTVTDKDGNTYTVTAPELDMKYESNGEVAELLESQDANAWLFKSNSPIQGTAKEEYTFDKDKLRSWFEGLSCVTDGQEPEDAYKELQDDDYWHIISEELGSKIDVDKAYALVEDAVSSGKKELTLTYEEAYVAPAITSDDTDLNDEVDKLNAEIKRQKQIEKVTNVEVSFEIVVDGETKTATLGQEDLKTMIVDDEDGNPVVEGDQVITWLTNWADENGLIEDQYLFVNCYGEIMSLPNGIDTGWKLDITKTAIEMYNAIDALESKSITPVLTDANGNLQNETTYVEIIIPEQRMLLHVNGEVVVDTPIVSGSLKSSTTYDTFTPSNGIWHIFYKTTDYHMKGPQQEDGSYEYESYVSYWMPFNNDIGIHDMNRPAFGGEIYLENGSHGCINTPFEAAEQIYQQVEVGTPVIVWGDSYSMGNTSTEDSEEEE